MSEAAISNLQRAAVNIFGHGASFYNRVHRSRNCAMTVAAALTPAHQRRLANLAKEAGCEAQALLDDIFKFGIDFVEQDVR